ncbi:hypothetical protein EDB89DRAFT_946817 [Lactarius sanguifluus]|nr:hypothetical protein EDB89DRAFT_946817 [Lactarius sanguifluus]
MRINLPDSPAKRLPIGRHETPDAKIHDEIRAEINAGHRFGSFANERAQNAVKWIDRRTLTHSPVAPTTPLSTNSKDPRPSYKESVILIPGNIARRGTRLPCCQFPFPTFDSLLPLTQYSPLYASSSSLKILTSKTRPVSYSHHPRSLRHQSRISISLCRWMTTIVSILHFRRCLVTPLS